jgi:hypothetical protein
MCRRSHILVSLWLQLRRKHAAPLCPSCLCAFNTAWWAVVGMAVRGCSLETRQGLKRQFDVAVTRLTHAAQSRHHVHVP